MGGYDHLSDQLPSRVMAVTSPGGRPGCAIRVEIHQGDIDHGGSDRDEFTATGTLWRNGQDVWYAMSFMLDRSSPLPPAGVWMLVHQFFAQDIPAGVSGGSPPLAVEVTHAGAILIDVRGGSKASAYDRAPRDSGYWLSDATPGTWHDLIFHVRWSTGSDGLVEVWQRQPNGAFSAAPQVSAPGPNVLTVAGHVLPVYAETGAYRSTTSVVQTVYHGGLWAAATRTAVQAALTAQATPPMVASARHGPAHRRRHHHVRRRQARHHAR